MQERLEADQSSMGVVFCSLCALFIRNMVIQQSSCASVMALEHSSEPMLRPHHHPHQHQQQQPRNRPHHHRHHQQQPQRMTIIAQALYQQRHLNVNVKLFDLRSHDSRVRVS